MFYIGPLLSNTQFGIFHNILVYSVWQNHRRCLGTNSVTSNFFPNETLTGCPFFFTHLWNRGTYKTLQQHVISCTAVKKWHASMFCMFPDSKSEWKIGATGQSFIRKEITCYRIGTLIDAHFFIFSSDCCITSECQSCPNRKPPGRPIGARKLA